MQLLCFSDNLSRVLDITQQDKNTCGGWCMGSFSATIEQMDRQEHFMNFVLGDI
jgi:hypothetical protein